MSFIDGIGCFYCNRPKAECECGSWERCLGSVGRAECPTTDCDADLTDMISSHMNSKTIQCAECNAWVSILRVAKMLVSMVAPF